MADAQPAEGSLTLVVRRIIDAPAERLFDAWTSAAQLEAWWGPAGVSCPKAEVDLRVGGAYRIANRLPDGQVSFIHGEFEVVERPRRLVYSWRFEGQALAERVTVQFDALDARRTEVIVRHERVAGAALRAQHQQGWSGCLDGLQRHVTA